MGIMEIILLIIGVLAFAASFFVPEKFMDNHAANIKEIKEVQEKLKTFLRQELQMSQLSIQEKTEETIVSATEKTERYMERITNEKIMAVQEYSDTVLEQIHKNHEEAVFLYDMLNSKHDQIKYTAAEINTTVENAQVSLKNTVQDTIQDTLKGSVQLSLQDKIREILENTIQDTIENTVKDTLEERINDAVQYKIQDSVQYSMPPTWPPVIGEEEKIEEQKMEEGFQEPALRAPEIIVQEEEPVLVQSIKKVPPKRKTPMKKTIARTRATIETRDDIENQFDSGNDFGTSNKGRILQLHKDGKSDVEIARELGLGIGEVKLVIGLFQGV